MFQISRFKISNKVRNAIEFSPPQDGRIDDGVDDIDTMLSFYLEKVLLFLVHILLSKYLVLWREIEVKSMLRSKNSSRCNIYSVTIRSRSDVRE